MAERLTVSLEDGAVERLRELAGGERKVGNYLSSVIAWLWLYREHLETQPLSNFAPVALEWIPRVTMSPEEQQQAIERAARIETEVKDQRQKIDMLWTEIQALAARIGAEDARIDAWADARDAKWAKDAAEGQQPE